MDRRRDTVTGTTVTGIEDLHLATGVRRPGATGVRHPVIVAKIVAKIVGATVGATVGVIVGEAEVVAGEEKWTGVGNMVLAVILTSLAMYFCGIFVADVALFQGSMLMHL